MKFIYYIGIFPLIFMGIVKLHAQQNMSLQGIDAAGQSILSDPAAFPREKITIGVPVVSGLSAELANSGFKMNDLLIQRTGSDSIDLNLDQVVSLLSPQNFSSAKLRSDLLFGGIRIGEDYLSFGVSSNFSAAFHYPADLIRLMWKGNAQFYDKQLNFNNLDLQLNHYISYHLGYSMKINKNLRIGTRVKYLRGLSNIYFEKFNLQFVQRGDPSEFNRFWFRTDIVINSSGLQMQDGFQFQDYFSGKNNTGFAFDLGLRYQLNEKISLSASVTDLGKIKWETANNNIQTKAEGYFEGITLVNGNDSIDYYNDFVDSLKSVLHVNESQTSYTSKLPARYALAAQYSINDRSELGIFTGLNDFSGFAEPYLRLSLTHEFSKYLLIRGSYSIKNRTYTNIGIGAVINLGPLQVFAFGDNIAGLLSPLNARMVNFNLGINLIF